MVEAVLGDLSRRGAVVLHGFGGSSRSVAPIVEALREAGFAVSAPELSGHGTAPADMVGVGWSDFTGDLEEACCGLADVGVESRAVVLVGTSMGAAVCLDRVARGAEAAGIVCVNPLVEPMDEPQRGFLKAMRDAGEKLVDTGPPDLADPDAVDDAYAQIAIDTLLSVDEASATLLERLPAIGCPVLVLTSRQDHAVDPANSDLVESLVTGPVERVWLEHSYHVAALDLDRELVQEKTVEFAERVTS